ncbi:MAG: PhoH family protein [Fibrobacteria bacterium]|nr:PhoH family protein [Fibrobacteria bacterium]
MIKTFYPIEGDLKIRLAGPAEAFLLKIEDVCKLKVLSCEEGFLFQSDSQEPIVFATKILDGLKEAINNQQEISEQSIENFRQLFQASSENSSTFEHYLQTPVHWDRYGKPVHARTIGQAYFIQKVMETDICLATGPAGTGKTFLAVALAVSFLNKQKVSKIVLARPAVESGEYLGFLPGDLREKIAPYMTPISDALNELVPADLLAKYREEEKIEIAPLAYMRGRTLNNCFIILDEAQNTTIAQMKMFLTRVGVDSKVIVAGDETQKDLPPKSASGLQHAKKILKHIPGIGIISLSVQDVVRHQLVKDIIYAYEKSEKRK